MDIPTDIELFFKERNFKMMNTRWYPCSYFTSLSLFFLFQLNAQVLEGNNEETVHHAVSFVAANTYLGLPQMKVYNSINIRLQFRTHEQNGLIFYNAGKASDFIALELVNGRLFYILNLGYGPISIQDTDMVSATF